MIDKIIEELEELYIDVVTDGDASLIHSHNQTINKAIEIVKKYDNDGWISVNDELPKYDTRILATFITNKGSIGVEDCWYSLINRCFETYKDFEKIPLGIKILAWQPLPQPYDEGK